MQDALVSLDEYIENWDEKDNTIEAIDQSIRDMAPDGNMYGLAQMFVTPVVWYNTNMLEQTGYDVPENWDDIFACIEAMTDKDAGKYGFAIRGGAGNSQQLEKMLYQYSGITEMFDEEGNSTINDPAHVELLDRLAKIYNVYTAESDITAAYTEMVAAFDSGSAGIIYHNLGSYGQHLETLGEGNFAGIVSLKAKNDTTALVSDGAMCLSVFKDSKHPEEAFRFISYLCEHEACSYISEKIGQIPCNKEALGDEWINEVDTVKESADALLDENTTIATLPINVIGYYDLHSNELVEGFQNVLLGNMSAQEYLDGWADQMTKLKADYDEYMKTL